MDPLWINTAIDYEVLVCEEPATAAAHYCYLLSLSACFSHFCIFYFLQVTDSRVNNSEASQTWWSPQYIGRHFNTFQIILKAGFETVTFNFRPRTA